MALVSTPLVVPPPSKRAKLSPAAAAPTKLSTVCAELSKLGAGTVRTQKGLLKKMCRVYLQARHRGLPHTASTQPTRSGRLRKNTCTWQCALPRRSSKLA